ncbi:MAG: PilX N-terminal domain-containing pilus assembly protein [Gallionella sp.]
MIKSFSTSRKQRGVVLFFALIALVVMSLAAVALIRSADTSTMIAGNLAYKQAAITAGDAGIELAMTWLDAEQTAMTNAGKSALIDADHTFNISNAANAALGYYSSVRDIAELTNGTVDWDDTDSKFAVTDTSGNTVRYIIERMCRNENEIPTPGNCLFTTTKSTLNDQKVLAADEMCIGAGCLPDAQSPQLRITARITGPKNTVSYIQSFVY